MGTIALRLHPDQLANPNTDLRYVLPDTIIERSGGVLADDGWGYEGEPPFMVLFLQATDLQAGLKCVLDVVENVRVMENDLQEGCVVAVRRDEGDETAEGSSEDEAYAGYEVVYPPGFAEPFAPWAHSGE